LIIQNGLNVQKKFWNGGEKNGKNGTDGIDVLVDGSKVKTNEMVEYFLFIKFSLIRNMCCLCRRNLREKDVLS
jgi:hypothetical protein